uniref:Putative secreted peptide n=1 Tax=Anopheles braziliensis TaxID=58242 RepID=A0A2M3ZTF8_9DIPT
MYRACMSTVFLSSSCLSASSHSFSVFRLFLLPSFTLFICRFQSLSLCGSKLTHLLETRSIRRNRSS